MREFITPIQQCFMAMILLGMATSQSGLHAQSQNPEDPEAYRRAKEAATRTFFDTDATVEERVKAAQGLGYPDRQTFGRLLILGADPKEHDAIRWEALRRYPWTPRLVTTVLEILADPDNGGEKLNADLLLDLSQRTVSVKSSKLRQAIQGGYRKLLEDQRDSIRLNAYYALVSSQDPVAITKLVEGMQNNQSPVPLTNAIRMLDVAGATRHFSTLRPYLKHDNDLVKAEASRVLAADAQSRPEITKLIQDQETAAAVRVQALRGMSRFDDNLASYAVPMIRNTEVPVKVRQAAMQAMVGQVNYRKLDDAVQLDFAGAVEAFNSDPNLQSLEDGKPQEEGKRLLDNLRKSSPAIRQYLEDKQ